MFSNSNSNTNQSQSSNNINESIGSGHKAAALFLDISRAFDSVDFKTLLSILEKAGVRGVVLDWYRSYLYGRSQRVKIVDKEGVTVSDSASLTCSVPQGSTLGPILFIIYMNEMCNISFHGKVVSYADDTALCYSQPSWKYIENNINEDLQKLNLWFSLRGLSISVDKRRKFR